MNKSDREIPGSFLALTVGIFIGALLVLPMFAYMCRVNGQLRQENLRLHTAMIQQLRLSEITSNCGTTVSLRLMIPKYPASGCRRGSIGAGEPQKAFPAYGHDSSQ